MDDNGINNAGLGPSSEIKMTVMMEHQFKKKTGVQVLFIWIIFLICNTLG